jgi:starch phosphorylase
MRSLYTRHLHPQWEEHLLDHEMWKRVGDIPDPDLWSAHRSQKERLIRFVRERVRAQTARHGRSPDEMRELERLFDPRALTIGFARRFATYKRAHLVLQDLTRVRALLGNKDRPVQMLFAGKPALKRSSTRTAISELPQFAMAAKSIFQQSSRRAMWPP